MARSGALLCAAFVVASCSNRLEESSPRLRVEIVPQSDRYELMQSILVQARDHEGTILSSGLEWSVDPLPAASSTNFEARATYDLTRVGEVTFRACLSGTTTCAAQTIMVEDTRPNLVITEPLPGAEVMGTRPIRITGIASRSVGVGPVTVTVNGVPASVAPSGLFETTIDPEFGLRHIRVVANDGVHPAARREFDVLSAPFFLPATDADERPSIEREGAIQLWFGQDFFDDGDTVAEPQTEPQTEDVARTLETLLTELDLVSLVPNPVVDTETLTLSLANASLDELDVEMMVAPDGLELFLRVGSLRGETSGSFAFESQDFDLAGRLDGSVSAFARIRIAKPSADAPVEIELAQFQITIDTLDAVFVDPEVDAVFAIADGLLRSSVENFVTDFVRESVNEVVPPLVDGLFAQLDSVLSDQTIPISYPPLPRTDVRLDGQLARIEATLGTALLASLDVRLGAGDMARHASLGFASAYSDSTSPEFVDQGLAQLGVRTSLLNGILHALWNAGFLDLDLTELLPPEFALLVEHARIDGRLPPTVRIARLGESDRDLVLSIGQLEIELEALGIRVYFGAALDVDVELTLIDNTLEVSFPTEPRINVWEIETSEGALLPAEAVEALVHDFWPSLRDAVSDVLRFELPIPPITAISNVSMLESIEIQIRERSPNLYERQDLLVLDLAIGASIR